MDRLVKIPCDKCEESLEFSRDQDLWVCSFCKSIIYDRQSEDRFYNRVWNLYGVLIYALILGVIVYRQFPELINSKEPELVSSKDSKSLTARVDYLDGSHNIHGLFEAEIGRDAQITRILIDTEFIHIWALSESSDQSIQWYRLENAGFADPSAKRVSSRGLKKMARKGFMLSEVDFSLIPSLLAKTITASGLQNLTSRHIVIERPPIMQMRRRKPRVSVHIATKGRSFYCSYRMNGTQTKCR